MVLPCHATLRVEWSRYSNHDLSRDKEKQLPVVLFCEESLSQMNHQHQRRIVHQVPVKSLTPVARKRPNKSAAAKAERSLSRNINVRGEGQDFAQLRTHCFHVYRDAARTCSSILSLYPLLRSE